MKAFLMGLVLLIGVPIVSWGIDWDGFVNSYHNAAGGLEITLDNDIFAIDGSLAFGEPALNNMIIDGNGKTINSQLKTDLAFVLTNKTLTFINGISFSSFSKSAASGGVFRLNNSVLNFENSFFNFTDNSVGSFGGAINSIASIISFIKSTANFINNKAYVGASIGDTTGSIFNFNYSSITFTNNNATGVGAAIAGYKSTISFNHSDITITYNNAPGGGAAFYATESKISFLSSTFYLSSNTSVSPGGAISALLSTLSIENSTGAFENNKGILGGAIYSNLKIDFINASINFTSNTSNDSGGAIYGENFLSNILTSQIKFIGNKSQYRGGAIAANASSVNFVNSSLVFSSNTSAAEGGAFSLRIRAYANFINTNVSFLGNAATERGGAFYVYELSTATFFNSLIEFSQNHSELRGGAMTNDDAYIVFQNSTITFSSNTSHDEGGAFSMRESAWTQFINSSVTFNFNSANARGGALFSDLANFKFENSNTVFSSNSATSRGGAIAGNFSQLYFARGSVDFLFNHSPDEGGAISVLDKDYIEFSTTTVSFIGNMAGGGIIADNDRGGAIYVENSTINFFNSKVNFSSNVAENRGGAFAANSANVGFTSGSVLFFANHADNEGGAVSIRVGARVVFLNATVAFTSNTSGDRGGAFYVNGNTSVTFNRSTVAFDFNHGDSRGGAFASSESFVFFNNSFVTFSSNTSSMEGGAVSLREFATMNFTNSTANFIGNTAQSNGEGHRGGALFAQDSNFKFERSKIVFASNSATARGGAIGSVNGNFNFLNSNVLFAYNNATSSGGAISLMNNSLMLSQNSQISFSSNISSNRGGAFFIEDARADFIDSQILFDFNHADYRGGAFAVINATVNFTRGNLVFSSNTSLEEGGALSLRINANANFNNATALFIGNFAEVVGGAIFLDFDAKPTFINSIITFTSNSARGSGGAILSSGGAVFAFVNSTISFIGNAAVLNGVTNDMSLGGGAMQTGTGAKLSFENSYLTFRDNFSGFIGGAIYIQAHSLLEIKKSTINFIDNSALYFAGAIDANTGSTISITNSRLLFSKNSALGDESDAPYTNGTGGAIDIYEDAFMFFTNSQIDFDKNAAMLGGAIYAFSSSVNFINSQINFSSNIASKKGGAIFSETDNQHLFLQILFLGSQIKFTSNSVNVAKLKENDFGGGAIATGEGAKIFFKNSKLDFVGNDSGFIGGAVYIQSNSLLDINRSTLTFVGNSAAYWGGALDAFMGSTISITNSRLSFSANSASGADNEGEDFYGTGGAIDIYTDSNLVFENSIVDFMGNYSMLGGALYAKSSNVTFLNTKANFIRNTAINGAGFFGAQGVRISFEHSQVVFSTNSASGDNTDLFSGGGAIDTGNNALMSINNSRLDFLGNNSGFIGGAIYIQSNSLFEVSNSTLNFLGNTATYYAGAIDAYIGSTITFTNSKLLFFANKAMGTDDDIDNYGTGGAIDIYTDSEISFLNTTVEFTKNESMLGGAFYAKTAKVNFANTQVLFASNTATDGAGVYIDAGVNMLFENSKAHFSGNSASRDGGAFYVNGNTTVTFRDSVVNFNLNYGKERGGAFASSDSYVFFERSDVNFMGNKSEKEGGALSLREDAFIEFRDLTVNFDSNEALWRGGAVYVEKSAISFINTQVSFLNNHSLLRGGAFGSSNSFVLFENSNVNFSSNISQSNGGALSVVENSLIYFKDSQINFYNNTGDTYAGAMYVLSSTVIFDNSEVNLERNFANNGQAMYLYRGSFIVLKNSTYTIDAGDIYIDDQSSEVILEGNNYFPKGLTMEGRPGYGQLPIPDGILRKIGEGTALFENQDARIYSTFILEQGTAIFRATKNTFGQLIISPEATLSLSGDGVMNHISITKDLLLQGTLILDFDFSQNRDKADYLILYGNIDIGPTVFYANILNDPAAEQIGISVPFIELSEKDSVIDFSNMTVIINSPTPEDYSVTASQGKLWLLYSGGAHNPWNLFVMRYQTQNAIFLGEDLSANEIFLPDPIPLPFGQSNTPQEFINGRDFTLNSTGFNDLGFSLTNTTIILTSITFSNFTKLSVDGGQGGVFSLSNSTLYLYDSEIAFIGNTAASGGAIFVGSNSNLIFENAKAEFRQNSAAGQLNDIELINSAKIQINNSAVTVSGAITGSGDIELSDKSVLDIAKIEAEDLTINDGSKIILRKESDIENITVSQGATFEIRPLNDEQVAAKADKINISGTLRVGIYGMSAGTLEASNRIVFTGTSTVLDIDFSQASKNPFTIKILSSNYISGDFNLKIGEGRKWSFNITDNEGWLIVFGKSAELKSLADTNNRKETSLALMAISENENLSLSNQVWELYEKEGKQAAQKSLDMISGSFLPEVLILTSKDENANSLYSKLKALDLAVVGTVAASSLRGAQRRGNPNRGVSQQTRLIQNTSWAEIHTSQNTLNHQENSLLGNTQNNTVSLKAGALVAANKNIALGFFISGINSEIKQDDVNWALVNSFEGGLYAGLFTANAEYKFHLSLGQHSFTTRRDIVLVEDYKARANFDAFSVKGGLEATHISRLKTLDFKPYGGVRFSMISNDEFHESGAEIFNLSVAQHNYVSLTGVGGLKLESVTETFSWYVKGEAGYLFTGNNESSAYRMILKDSQTKRSMDIRGLEIAPLTYGGGLGVDVPLSDTLSLYTDAQYSANANISYAQINAGVKILFGKNIEMRKYQARKKQEQKLIAARRAKERAQKLAQQKSQIAQQRLALEKQSAALNQQKQAVLSQKQKLQNELRTQRELANQRRKNAKKTFRLKAASFNANSATLSPQAINNIAKMAQELKKMSYRLITVEGHTDTSGSYELNVMLSQARAQAVIQELIRNGIPKAKLKFIGLGPTMPIAPNSTPTGRTQNRRAEIFVE
jgi:predicted outer membrane repeat protein